MRDGCLSICGRLWDAIVSEMWVSYFECSMQNVNSRRFIDFRSAKNKIYDWLLMKGHKVRVEVDD